MPRESILIVAGDTALRRSLKSTLQSLGYEIITAASAFEALMSAANHQGPIDLLLADRRLAGIDGARLAEKFTQAFPDAAVLLLSEPVEPERLAEAVRQSLASRRKGPASEDAAHPDARKMA